MTNHLSKRVIRALLLAAVGSSGLKAQNCPNGSYSSYFPPTSMVQIIACIQEEVGLGKQSVFWGAKNLTNDKLEIRFVKVVYTTCGTVNRSNGDTYLEPGEFVGGTTFSGEMTFETQIWAEDCNHKKNRIKSVAYEGLKIRNLSKEERDREQKRKQQEEKDALERQKKELEQKREAQARQQQNNNSQQQGTQYTKGNYTQQNTSYNQSSYYQHSTDYQSTQQQQRVNVYDELEAQRKRTQQYQEIFNEGISTFTAALVEKQRREEEREEAQRQREEEREQREAERREREAVIRAAELREEIAEQKRIREENLRIQQEIRFRKQMDSIEVLQKKAEQEEAVSSWKMKAEPLLYLSKYAGKYKRLSELHAEPVDTVYYLLWKLGINEEFIIYNPIAIKRSPDGDWMTQKELYAKVLKDTGTDLYQAPDGTPTKYNELGFLMGYFTDACEAITEYSDLLNNAANNGYKVKQEGQAFENGQENQN